MTNGQKGMAGSIAKAEELKKSIPGSVILQQFENPANTEVHARSTGEEIWQDTDGEVAAFVVFYFVFYFAITKFDLKTPGREDEDAEEAEKKVVLANNNYTEVAAGVLKAIGGKEKIGRASCRERV